MSPPNAALSHRLCAFCPSLCRFACPVEEVGGRETTSPRFMVALGHHLTVGALEWSHAVAEAVTACDGCGACTEVCEHDVPVAEVLRGARQEAKAKDLTPAAAGQVAENLAAGLGPGGRFLDRSLREVRPDRIGARADLLVWPSDRGLEAGPEALEASCRFLDALGVAYALPAPEALVPSPRWAAVVGAKSLEKDLGKRLAKAWKGATRVFCEDPEDLALAHLAGVEAITYWHLAPPQGLGLDGPAEYFLGPRRDDPELAELGAALGLRPLLGFQGLRVSPGAAELFDLLRPALAHSLRAKALGRAGAAAVLFPSEHLAAFWEAGGGTARRLAELRPRGRL